MTIPIARTLHAARALAVYALERDTLLRSIRTALVVGTILGLLNHGLQLLSGHFALEWVVPLLLTYLVPFSVATYAQVRGKQQRDRAYSTVSADRQASVGDHAV